MTTFTLVRHGATKLNNETSTSQDKIRGWANVPLSDEGRNHAKETAKKLKNHGIEILVTSDLDRAKETAEIVGKAIGVKPILSKKLRPWNLGDLTGKSTKEAIPKIKEYIKKPKVPVPDGESFDDFKHRAFAGLADCFEVAAGKKLCIITHHRMERLIKSWIAAGCPDDHGLIDLNVFSQKGEPPGNSEEIAIDEKRLRKMRKEKDPVRGAIKRAVSDVKANASKEA